MRIIYCTSNGFISALIRFFTFSKWSHVAIEYNGVVIDSTSVGGVAESSLKRFMATHKSIHMEELTGVDEEAVWRFLKSQVGKKYDFRAIFAFPFRESWDEDDQWFCTEILAAAIIKGGRKLKIKSKRITPKGLWLML